MGAVTGFIPTSMALISSQTPKEEAGRTLGTLQMGTVSGGLFGPVIGGLLADNVGFSYTFIFTSIAIAIAATVVLFGIDEQRNREQRNKRNKYSSKEVLQHIFSHKLFVTVLILSCLIQVANFSIQPLLALYVDELTSSSNLAFLAGIAFSATGFGNLLPLDDGENLATISATKKCLSVLSRIWHLSSSFHKPWL